MHAWNEQFSSFGALRYGDGREGFDKSLFLIVFQKHLGMALLLRLLRVLLGPTSVLNRSFGCSRGDQKRESSLPSSRLSERDDFGLADCLQESCLGCG